MSCQSLNKQNKGDDDGWKDDDEEWLVEDMEEFENHEKPNLEETEIVNLGDHNEIKETSISVHLTAPQREDLIHLLWEYIDVFAWSYDDMPGLSTSIVSHKLPINSEFDPVKQKMRKFKPDLSLKIKEEVTKQIQSKVVEVTKYPTWLANIVPVPKKDDKI